MFQFPHGHCVKCGKMTRGPHANEVYDARDSHGQIIPIYAADKNRVYTQEEAEAAGLPYNVGSDICPSCYQEVIAAGRKSKIGRYGAERRDEARAERQRKHAQWAAQMERRQARAQEAKQEAQTEESAAQRAREAYTRGAQPRPPITPEVPVEPAVEAEARARKSYKRRES